MIEENQRPIMSPNVVNSGNQVSINGYLNTEEFMKTLNKALKSSSIWAFVTFVALTFAGDFEQIYVGPYAAEIASVVALVRAYFVAKKMGAKYLEEGETL